MGEKRLAVLCCVLWPIATVILYVRNNEEFACRIWTSKDNMKPMELCRGEGLKLERRELIYRRHAKRRQQKDLTYFQSLAAFLRALIRRRLLLFLLGAFSTYGTGDPRLQCGCQALVQSR